LISAILGVGFPELGSVRVLDLMAVRGPLGLAVERDLPFKLLRTLSQYADVAMMAGAIRT
jgi:hypothetical protein